MSPVAEAVRHEAASRAPSSADASRPEYCGVAQLVERRIVNPVVGGSSPPATARFNPTRSIKASKAKRARTLMKMGTPFSRGLLLRERFDRLPANRFDMPTLKTQLLLGKKLDPRVQKIYDVYQRASEIYQRTKAAMGRSPKYRVTVSNTTSVRFENGVDRTSRTS